MKNRIALVLLLTGIALLLLIWRAVTPHDDLAGQRTRGWPVHTSSAIHFMDALAASLHDGPVMSGVLSGCANLDTVFAHEVDKYQQLLQMTPDVMRLQKLLPDASCTDIAERLATVSVLEMQALQQAWRHTKSHSDGNWRATVRREVAARGGKPCSDAAMTEPSGLCGRLYASPMIVRAASFQTRDGFWAKPGCLQPAEGPGCMPRDLGLAAGVDRGDAVVALVREHGAGRLLDVRGQDALLPAQRHGENLRVTLQPELQRRAELLTYCFTQAAPRPDSCKEFDLPDQLPAGVASLVVAEVSSGKIVSMAQAISHCSLVALVNTAKDGQVFSDDQVPCAAQPDAHYADVMRSSAIAVQEFPLASTFKVVVATGTLQRGVTFDHDDIRKVLAESHLGDPIKRLAFAAGPVAVKAAAESLGMIGGDNPLLREPKLGELENPAVLANTLLDFDFYRTIRDVRGQEHGVNTAIKLFGKKMDASDSPYWPTHTYALLATGGGGEFQASQMHLLQMYQTIAATANGMKVIKELHVLESERQPVGQRVTDLTLENANELLDLTSWVTKYDAVTGTAGRACRRIFGHCPLQGVYGKTGTVIMLKDKTYCTPVSRVVPIPVRHFSSAFSADGGKAPTHVLSVVIFRTRSIMDNKSCLEDTSYASELALRMIQYMRQQGKPDLSDRRSATVNKGNP